MTSNTTLSPVTPHALRVELEELILNDLLGPAGGPNEEVDESFLMEGAPRAGSRSHQSERTSLQVASRTVSRGVARRHPSLPLGASRSPPLAVLCVWRRPTPPRP